MDWIESLIQNYGVAAMFVLIMLGNMPVFPVSSEIILPLAGGMAAGQGLFFPCLVAFGDGEAGLIGALVAYGIGRSGGSLASCWNAQAIETLFFYGETNPNLLPCLWQSPKKVPF